MQVEDPQVPAPPVDVLDPLDVLLMQRNFLQGEDLTLVVLGPSADHVLRDWTDRDTAIDEPPCSRHTDLCCPFSQPVVRLILK